MKKFLVVLLLMVAASTIVQAKTFVDVEGLNCKQAVQNLEHIGIVNGVNVNEYAPRKSVTRAELAKMIVNALDAKNSSKKTFQDIQGHWGKTFIEQAAGLGILNGYTDGTFRPDKEVSYAEAITILVRSLGYQNLESNLGKWYDNYISKMSEIGLNNGMETFNAEEYANRGDIAILLWNTIKSTTNGESLLERNFSDFQYFEGQKVVEISRDNNRILYRTADFYFYVDEGINFSDLGGIASGLLNTKSLTVSGLEIDAGRNLKKISGNTKEVNAQGYDVFECNDIWGYGTKEKAKYVEIFVNEANNKTERVVYYDTTQSHLATTIKIATNKIKIESKDVYDTSIIIHNGQTIHLKILRTETVQEIDSKALVVYDGKIVPWTSVPDNSVVREIKKNLIYTYIHKYDDIALNSKDINSKGITIDGKEYAFSEDCIVENVKTETAMKLTDGLTREDLKTIAEKEDKVRIYFNEFDEIVKFEFSYDIWGIHQEEEIIEENKDLEPQLKKIGIVSSFGYVTSSDKEEDKVQSKISPLPRKNVYNFTHIEGSFKIGDFVYLSEVEKKDGKKTKIEKTLNKITSSTSIKDLNVVPNYSGYIEENKLGVYSINDQTEYMEVVLTKSKEKEGEYSKCSMAFIDRSALGKNTKYETMHLILNKDNVVLRVYAIKEIGITLNVGVVKNIETEKSGETITSQKVYITGENKGMKRYIPETLDNFEVGDLVTYKIKKATNKKYDDTVIVDETYNHKTIGNSRDLIIEKSNKGIITFTNSKDVVDLSKDTFVIGDKEYEFEDYTIINAEVEKDSVGEWIFRYFSFSTKNNIKAKAGSRFVVDELTRTIVIYSGYEK
ncbi:MAG: S-layer homology domain-containing protein [Clostridia bacterium]|nr:S-layer homology domain-containing protein [Clostridia bacterium]